VSTTREDVIYAMWMQGKTLEDIAKAFDITEIRACHEVNDILNERDPRKAPKVQGDLF
jgi:hypothetical protein